MRIPTLVFVFLLAASGVISQPSTARSDAPPPSSGAKSGSATPAPTADDVAARVQSFYNQTRTFQAEFKQEYLIKMHNQKKSSDGRVVFQKPGKMSWTYNQPNGNRVVSDGRILKVYEKEDQQMFEQAVDKSQYPAALAFLMGQGELTKSFSLRLLDASAMKFEGGYVLEATPNEPTAAYQLVLLYVDAATAQVRRVLILDAQGNRNRFDFSNAIVNNPVPAGEFSFTPPAGTQIVHP